MGLEKTEILNLIKSHLKFNKEVELANYLGIKGNTLANWRKRNTFDHELIFTKCEFINPAVLLGGEGDLINKKEDKNPEQVIEKNKNYSDIQKSIEELIISHFSDKLDLLFKNYKEDNNSTLEMLTNKLKDLEEFSRLVKLKIQIEHELEGVAEETKSSLTKKKL